MNDMGMDDKLAEVVRKYAPRSQLRRVWSLTGGVSAQVIALEVEHPGRATEKWVVRLHGERDRRANPNIAADEFRLLHILQAAGLQPAGIAAPRPLYQDSSGEIFAIPYIIIEYIAGETDFAPADLDGYLQQCAAHLARIHCIHGAQPDLSFLPQLAPIVTARLAERVAPPDESLHEGKIHRILQAAWPFRHENPPALLHGDYWPGNLLWQAGRLVAVLDWEDAVTGDPLMDLANSRLELRWAFGPDAVQRFTRYYQIAIEPALSPDFANLPYWDLYAALRQIPRIATWNLAAETEQAMRASLESFTNDALKRISN